MVQYGVDTDELWPVAASAADVAAGLGEALTSLGIAVEDVHRWCPHPYAADTLDTAGVMMLARLRAAQATAAGLAERVTAAAQSYRDVDAPRPR